MGDPLSIGVGALQIADATYGVSHRIIRFVRDLKEVDLTTEELFNKLNHLMAIVQTIEKLVKRRKSEPSESSDEEDAETFSTMESILKLCDKDIDTFTKLLDPLRGKSIHRLTKQMRLDWNEKHLSRLEKNVQWNIMLLQTVASCTEVFTHGNFMSRLAGKNDDIARSMNRMQKDFAKLRSAFESSGKLRRETSSLGASTEVDSFDEAIGEDIGRMKTAIVMTESLCDRVSTMGSAADADSERVKTEKALSNTASTEEEEEDYHFVHGHEDLAGRIYLNTGVSIYGFNEPNGLDFREDLSPKSEQITPALRQAGSPHALPLPVMERMMEEYQNQASKDLEDPTPRYKDAEDNLSHSLERGAQREQAHNIPFTERFDISIQLARAQLGQNKFIETEETLESMRCLIGQDTVKIGKWSCALAKLYQCWYNEAPNWRLLAKLEEYATLSYNTAHNSTSLTSTREQNLHDSATALIAFLTWNHDKVGAETLQKLHPSAGAPLVRIPTQESHDSVQNELALLPSLSYGSSTVGSSASVVGRPTRRATTDGSTTDLSEVSIETSSQLLLAAAKSKCAELVQYHVKRGDVNCRDLKERTPLHLALSGMGGKEVVSILVEHGADVNAKDASGDSPLHVCAELNKDELANKLIERGAAVDALNERGETPLDIAVRKKILRMVECFLAASATVGDASKSSGSKEIDFVIHEHLSSLSPSRATSVNSKGFWRR